MTPGNYMPPDESLKALVGEGLLDGEILDLAGREWQRFCDAVPMLVTPGSDITQMRHLKAMFSIGFLAGYACRPEPTP